MAKKTVSMRAVITVDYEANPKYYGTDNPKEMAKIDLENSSPYDALDWGEVEFDVHPLEDK